MTARLRVRVATWRAWRRLQGAYLTVGAQGLEDPSGPQCTHVPNYVWRRLGVGQLFGNASSWVGRAPFGAAWIPAAELTRIRVGDTIVFAAAFVGVDGHVDVCLNGAREPWVGMDQNWPIGAPVSRVLHTRDQVAGVIRVGG